MSRNNRCSKKVFRFFFSFQRERKWLEEMAEEGWFFSNLTLGMIYAFVRGEPK